MATNSKSISQIIESLKSQMISLGYKQATIERYDAVWRGLIAFCNENYRKANKTNDSVTNRQ